MSVRVLRGQALFTFCSGTIASTMSFRLSRSSLPRRGWKPSLAVAMSSKSTGVPFFFAITISFLSSILVSRVSVKDIRTAAALGLGSYRWVYRTIGLREFERGGVDTDLSLRGLEVWAVSSALLRRSSKVSVSGGGVRLPVMAKVSFGVAIPRRDCSAILPYRSVTSAFARSDSNRLVEDRRDRSRSGRYHQYQVVLS